MRYLGGPSSLGPTPYWSGTYRLGLPEGLAQPSGDQLPHKCLWQWHINGKLKCPGRNLVFDEFLS